MERVPFFRSMLTGRDNVSGDIVKFLTALVVTVVCGIEFDAVVIRGAAFDIVTFSVAVGGLITNGAVGQRVKGRVDEPEAKQ